MRFLLVWREQVHDVPPPGLEVVGNQRAMTAPPDGFGTHHGSSCCRGETIDARNAFCKGIGLHVIGISAKRRVAPRRIRRIRERLAPPTKLGQPDVPYAHIRQRVGQCLLVELRISARTRKSAHVSNCRDRRGLQQRYKLLDRTRRVANRPQRLARVTDAKRFISLRADICYPESSAQVRARRPTAGPSSAALHRSAR